jgi:hypothetical protein
MLYDEQQGHDAQLDGIAIDVLRRTASLRLSSYPSQNASGRVAIEIVFSNVEQVHTIADLAKLEDNHTSGNVNYWHVADGPGASYFYLVEGCLVITAQTAPVVSLR